MSRVQLTRACYIDYPGPGRLRAGQWVSNDPASLQPGDVFSTGLDLTKLPTDHVSTVSGADSIGG